MILFIIGLIFVFVIAIVFLKNRKEGYEIDRAINITVSIIVGIIAACITFIIISVIIYLSPFKEVLLSLDGLLKALFGTSIGVLVAIPAYFVGKLVFHTLESL